MKFVVDQTIDQMICLEQTYKRLLYIVDNHCWQFYNEVILLQWLLNEGRFRHVFFIYLFLVLPTNLIVSSLSYFPFYLCIFLLKYFQSFLRVFSKYIQNNLEYLMQNMVRQITQIFIPCWIWCLNLILCDLFIFFHVSYKLIFDKARYLPLPLSLFYFQ